MKRIRRFFARVVEALLSPFKSNPIPRVKNWVKDPSLDAVGVGVISTLVGRTVLFGSVAVLYLLAGSVLNAGVMIALIGYDIMTHAQVLSALRKLMRYEIVEELISSFSQAA